MALDGSWLCTGNCVLQITQTYDLTAISAHTLCILGCRCLRGGKGIDELLSGESKAHIQKCKDIQIVSSLPIKCPKGCHFGEHIRHPSSSSSKMFPLESERSCRIRSCRKRRRKRRGKRRRKGQVSRLSFNSGGAVLSSISFS